MTFTDEERVLHRALGEGSLGQPDAPLDRMAGIRRRHARRRVAQATAAALTVVAVGLGAALTGGAFRTSAAEPLNRPVPSWALPWPDHRDGSVPQKVLDGAVIAWRHLTSANGSEAPVSAPKRVIWYVGQRIDAGRVIAVVFEVDGPVEHRLVAGWVTASEVDKGQPAFSQSSTPWVLYDVAAPASSFGGFVGLNAHGDAADAEGNFHNWVVLVTRPRAARLYISNSAGYRSIVDGLSVFDAGALRSPVDVTVTTASGSALASGRVGVPGAPQSRVPQLARVADLVGAGSGSAVLSEFSGQGESAFSDGSVRAPAGTPTTIYARCFGARSIRVALEDERPTAGVTVPCDDRQHAVPGPSLKAASVGMPSGGKAHLFFVHASEYAAWRVAVAIAR
jgi:hypothetical protein